MNKLHFMEKTVVLDSSFLIAYCAKESGRFAAAEAALARFANENRTLFAPGVAISESLFALCRKSQEGALTKEAHEDSVKTLILLLGCIHQHPDGDFRFTERAEQIRNGYGCSRSADGLFLALTEALAGEGDSEIVTFDVSMKNQAASKVPNVRVIILN